ncbi:MAG: 4Fe-4S dicluster domain-containing protein [Mucinivorans sp.]
MSISWGYTITVPRSMNLDTNDMTFSRELLLRYPELQACIACGACTATCTAGALTDFNIRQLQTLVRRGEYAKAAADLDKCMLCGKCTLCCPRGINTRGLILFLRRNLPSKQ